MKKKSLFFGFLLSILAIQSIAQQPIYVGLQNFRYSQAQRNSNWCWAASIQMIFNYYGVDIAQEDIVARSYGTDRYGSLPNWTGNFEVITNNLNNWNIDRRGRSYTVGASLQYGAPNAAYLVQELSAQRPVLVGYNSGNGGGHAVVITALSYIQTPYGPQIQTIIVRDPWPSQQNIASSGRNEYPAANFANAITAHWYIRVY